MSLFEGFVRISFPPWMLAFLLTACGSRTPLDLDDMSTNDSADAGRALAEDASSADDTSAPPDTSYAIPDAPPGTVAQGGYCYGDVTSIHGTTCVPKASTGTTCDGTLTCDGDHELTIHCENGLCTCINVGFNRCYCEATEGLADPCGPENCCWR